MSSTTISRAIAIVAGTLSAAAALAVMLHSPDGENPHALTLDHALMPVVILLTITAGHYAPKAFGEWRLASGLGWLAVAIVGTTVTLYTSLGRQNAVTDSQIKSVEEINRQRRELSAKITATSKLLEKSMSEQSTRCAKSLNTDSCRGTLLNVKSFTSTVERLQKQLRELGPERTVAPRATRLAETVALFTGWDAEVLRTRVMALEPFAYAILFEIGALVAFGYAFTRSKEATVIPRPASSADAATPQEVTGPSVEPLAPRPRRSVSKTEARAQVAEIPSVNRQDELADRLGVHKSTMSRWLKQWERDGLVTRENSGRAKTVMRCPRQLQLI